MDAGAFAAAVAFARRGGSYFISDYKGLWQRSPVLAGLLAGFLISLAGVPPMAGAWAKLFVFMARWTSEVYWLAVVMGVNAVIAAWYYLAVVKRMFFDAPEETPTVEVPYLMRLTMGVAALALSRSSSGRRSSRSWPTAPSLTAAFSTNPGLIPGS